MEEKKETNERGELKTAEKQKDFLSVLKEILGRGQIGIYGGKKNCDKD